MDFLNDFWQYFRKDRMALIGLVGLLLVIFVAIAAPVLSPFDYAAQDLGKRLQAPGREHWLGTDGYGRDLLSRILWGARISLRIGFFGAGLTILIGTFVGAFSGYFEGALSDLSMRVTDAIMSIPPIFLILVIVAIFGASTKLTVLVIGLVYWPGTARLLRGEFLRFKNQDFVEAGRAIGASDIRIIMRHVLPNAFPTLIVQSSLLVAETILIEAGLSYLGLGAQPPTPSWGNTLTEGRRFVDVAWWIATFPGIAIFVTVLSFNLVGDALRGALDPYHRRSR